MVFKAVAFPTIPVPDESVGLRPVPEERNYENLNLSQVYELLSKQASENHFYHYKFLQLHELSYYSC